MYAIVDIETTGGHASANGITEIAIYIHDGTKLLRHYTSLVNPEQHIPSYITALTGISNAMVAAAPVFADIAKEVHELLSGNIFVAHNVNFDYSFVKLHLKASGYDLGAKKLCTVRLSRKVFPGMQSYGLGKLCRSLQISIEGRHRADGDARATVILFERLLAAGATAHIDIMLKRNSADQWLPLHLDKKEIDSLPLKPGVYYFHNNKGKIIYVGKAVNIRKRVTSHFTQNDGEKKRQHFLRYVHKISHTVCANELHALVLESTEIKRLWPKYNLSQKQPDQRYGLYCFEDNRGYLRVAIDKRKKNLPALYHFNLLHEGKVLLKNMVEQFELSRKLCFLDEAAITDKDVEFLDEPHLYNRKVNAALESLDEQLPTFAIVDKGVATHDKLCLLIERGSFWGMGYIDDTEQLNDIHQLKDKLEPYRDNDFIRNSIYAYVEANPEKKYSFEKKRMSREPVE